MELTKIGINEVVTVYNEGGVETGLGSCEAVIIAIRKKTDLIIVASHFKVNRNRCSLTYNRSDGPTHIESIREALQSLGHFEDIIEANAMYFGKAFNNGLFFSNNSNLLFPRNYNEVAGGIREIFKFDKPVPYISYCSYWIRIKVYITLGVVVLETDQGDDMLLL